MTGYLSKPYSEAQLAEALAPFKQLNDARADEPGEATAPEGSLARRSIPPAGGERLQTARASRSGTSRSAKVRAAYLRMAPRLASSLGEAAAHGDAVALAGVAKSLCAASAKAGAAEIAELAALVEQEARAGEVATAAERVMRIAVLVSALAQGTGARRSGAAQRPIRRA